MRMYRCWMVIGLTFLVIDEVVCDDVDYSAKLASILSSKDAGESTKLVSELMKHAHSAEKHETVPDVSAFAPASSADTQLKDRISSSINKHIGGVASVLNNKSGQDQKSRAQQVKQETDRLKKGTQDAIRRAEQHMVKLEEVETVSSEIKASLATASTAADVIKRRVASFTKLTSDIDVIAKELHSNLEAIREDIDYIRRQAENVGDKTWDKIIWYYVILGQLFLFVAYIFFQRSRMGIKPGMY
ncbi:hypothetical protein NDN08_004328 [Rhodosorus marinus]|uniref:GOLD domain-containing protein n=1 Tax=Rhodosorus marinus TaxID=101924 RepID=A0AAV8UQ58_9RHOD|nr:hypothetical protein NDN08_004328 [Rhodosorus marinus]